MKKYINSIVVAYAIFTILIPLSFYFNEGDITQLINSEYKWIVWSLLAAFCIFLVAFGKTLSNKQLLGLSIAFFLIPFSFRFSGEGFQFLVLTQNAVLATAYLLVGIIILIVRKFRPFVTSNNRGISK